MMHLLIIWRVRISGDLNLYFSVGRGLLNHLQPYADLFEDKPPGIFFLSALSLALTGDNKLYSLCSMLSLLGIVAAMVLYSPAIPGLNAPFRLWGGV